MARALTNLINGRVDNLVFYQMNGKSYVRRRPSYNRKPSKDEEMARQRFALASKYGSGLVHRLKRELFYAMKLADYNRVRGWMVSQFARYHYEPEWKINSAERCFCSLHSGADLRNALRLDVQFNQLPDGKVEVHIPAFTPAIHITAPAHATDITMKMMLVGSSFSGLNPTVGFDANEWTFPWRYTLQDARSFTLSAGLMPGDMMMLVLAVKYTIVERQQEFVCQLPEYAVAAVIGMGKVI